MSKKAIKVDLSIFFDDERKMSCVLVDPNWKNVACLQKRVELLFDVDSVRFLSDGCFLPPQESIEILKFCNDLKAFVPKETLTLRKNKKSIECKNIENLSKESCNEVITFVTEFDQQQVHDKSRKKRKYKSLESAHQLNSLPNKAKRSKNSNKDVQDIESRKSTTDNSEVSSDYPKPTEHNQACEAKSESYSNIVENSFVPKVSDDELQSRHPLTSEENPRLEMQENNLDETINDEIKATSKRSSSIPSSTFLNESKMLEDADNASLLSNSTNSNNPFKKAKSSGMHIYFNESGEVLSPTTKAVSKSTSKKVHKSKTIVVFRCPLSDVTNDIQPQKPRIFHLESKNRKTYTPKKQIVEIREQIILPPHFIEKANEESKTSDLDKRKETKETDKSDFRSEKSYVSDTKIATGATTITNNDKERVSVNDLEVSRYENADGTNTQNESQMNVDETSIMSVDCVDLSMDLDHDVIQMQQIKKIEIKLEENVSDKHNLSADYEGNTSYVSDVEEISEIIDVNETDDNCNTTLNNSTRHNSFNKDIRVNKVLPFTTDLTDVPKIGDIIVFKVPYLNKNKKLVNTKFMAGKVEYVNRRTKNIKVLIVDGNLELCLIPNQFMCKLDDSEDYVKYLQLKLSDMREPKLFVEH